MIVNGRDKLIKLIRKENNGFKLTDEEVKQLCKLIQWYKDDPMIMLSDYGYYVEDLEEEELSYHLFPKKDNGNIVISLDNYKEYKRILNNLESEEDE